MKVYTRVEHPEIYKRERGGKKDYNQYPLFLFFIQSKLGFYIFSMFQIWSEIQLHRVDLVRAKHWFGTESGMLFAMFAILISLTEVWFLWLGLLNREFDIGFGFLDQVRLNLRLISIGGGSSRGTVLHVLLRIWFFAALWVDWRRISEFRFCLFWLNWGSCDLIVVVFCVWSVD